YFCYLVNINSPKFPKILSGSIPLVVTHKTTLDLLNNFKGQ
ncbi:MAG: hypothetical protein ACI8VY_001074, partial [Cellvibrionaceae bacterium]